MGFTLWQKERKAERKAQQLNPLFLRLFLRS
ncbi:hypothetical protein HPOKI112_00765 [Helicobacter pylori oki112]|nr:hypothetical protein HPOKI112_00765 [Helicobacter pylori oki112]